MRQEWIDSARAQGCRFIVGCGDSFDNSYYPCYCKTKKEADREADRVRRSSMQTVFEIYEVEGLNRKYERDYEEDV